MVRRRAMGNHPVNLAAPPEPPHPIPEKHAAVLEENFLQSVPQNRRKFARNVLELAKTGYRLRNTITFILIKFSMLHWCF